MSVSLYDLSVASYLQTLTAISGWVAISVGAILGAMALIWLWQKYAGRG